MRVLVATAGSRGDVQPMLALALGLRDAGHTVTFSASPDFEPWARRLALPFQPCGRNFEETLRAQGIKMRDSLGLMRREVGRQYSELAVQMKAAEVVVGASLHLSGPSFAELYGIPYFYAAFAPVVLESRFHSPVFFPWPGLPEWMNAALWKGTNFGWNMLFRSILNEERRKLGLGPIADVWSHIQTAHLLFAGEPALAALAPDAPPGVVTTGAWILPETEELDPSLEAFLREGDPPVYIGFGSMTDKDSARTSRVLIEAVKAAGVRALISSGWAGYGGEGLPPSIRVIGSTPHSRLFPRVAGVVHHGGAGTTAAAARAGVPQVVVPHIFDQFLWATRTKELGLSLSSIARSELTVARLAAALRELVSNTELRARAQAFERQLIRDGVSRAVHQIELRYEQSRRKAS